MPLAEARWSVGLCFGMTAFAACHPQTPPGAAVLGAVSPNAQRFTVPVTDMVLVSSLSPERTCLPDPVELGGRDPDAVLLLRFALPWASNAVVERAVLTLSRSQRAIATDRASAPLQVSRILEPWDAREVRYRHMPQLSARTVTIDTAQQISDGPIRLDITSIVQRWQTGRPDEQGLAILSKGDALAGWACSTGTAFGRAPRLDLYLR